jgi:hypothetical protein
MVGRVINGRGIVAHATAADLQAVLLADAAITGGAGVVLALGAGPLGDALGFSSTLLRWVGLALIPCALLMADLGMRERIARRWVRACIGANLLWVIASGLLLISDWVEPTGLGIAFVIAQALVVAAVADLEWLSLRRGSEA